MSAIVTTSDARKVVIFGSDHAGLPLKAVLTGTVAVQGYTVHDLGTNSPASCDYPAYALEVCRKVLARPGALGILICGSGLGMSMAANRVQGIRAALCHNEYMARMARMHNNANVLCLGARILGVDLAQAVTDAFLAASFEGGRHQRRIDLFDSLGCDGQ